MHLLWQVSAPAPGAEHLATPGRDLHVEGVAFTLFIRISRDSLHAEDDDLVWLPDER